MASIRFAKPTDVHGILQLVRALAVYERQPDAVKATEADFLRDGFGEQPAFECLIAEEFDAQGQVFPVGFALYFKSYSTWQGRPGLHLEDLFVLPEYRGQGIGKALLRRVAARAVEQGFDRLGWHVLEWNQPAIAFYHSLAGDMLGDWRIMRVADEALLKLAGRLAVAERTR
jgi:GNAT superfamily N-acetyltransferase